MPVRGNPATIGGRIRGAVAAVGNAVRGFGRRLTGRGAAAGGNRQGGKAKS